VLYLATPSVEPVRDAMRAGRLGCMTTPAQGNRIPEDALYACDNGKYGEGWPGTAAWRRWLARKIEQYGAGQCLWAAAPDVPFDAAGTLRESGPELAGIRALGVPAAFCAQDGSEAPGLIPWDDLDVLFLAGSTEWKLSYIAAGLADEAHARSKKVHVGRVNSRKRIAHADAIGAETGDGTFIRFGPDKNLARLERFQADLRHRQPAGVQFSLLDVIRSERSA
jgi:hypothetical protein